MLLVAQQVTRPLIPSPPEVLRSLVKVRVFWFFFLNGLVLTKQLLAPQICANALRDGYRCRPRKPTSYNSWGQRLKGGLSLLSPSHPASITRTPALPQLARLPASFLYYNRWQMVKRDPKRKNTKGAQITTPAGKQAAE